MVWNSLCTAFWERGVWVFASMPWTTGNLSICTASTLVSVVVLYLFHYFSRRQYTLCPYIRVWTYLRLHRDVRTPRRSSRNVHLKISPSSRPPASPSTPPKPSSQHSIRPRTYPHTLAPPRPAPSHPSMHQLTVSTTSQTAHTQSSASHPFSPVSRYCTCTARAPSARSRLA